MEERYGKYMSFLLHLGKWLWWNLSMFIIVTPLGLLALAAKCFGIDTGFEILDLLLAMMVVIYVIPWLVKTADKFHERGKGEWETKWK